MKSIKILSGLFLSGLFFISTTHVKAEEIKLDEVKLEEVKIENSTNDSEIYTYIEKDGTYSENQAIVIEAEVRNKDFIDFKMAISDVMDNSDKKLEIDNDFNTIEVVDEAKNIVETEISFFDIEDENGNDLTDRVISQTVDGNNITQRVDVSGIQGTLTATAYASGAYSYSHYFSSSKWITRTDGISLSIQPKSTLTAGTSNPNYGAIRASDSWNRIVEKHSKDSKWKNTSSMKSQYICHYNNAKSFKTPWNLEPRRTGTATLKNLCNP